MGTFDLKRLRSPAAVQLASLYELVTDIAEVRFITVSINNKSHKITKFLRLNIEFDVRLQA